MKARADLLDLSTIYRTHVREVARWAERLAGPGLDLPDVVHEVFEIVQRKLPSFRGDSSLPTWLFGITEKVVRHRRRKDRLRHWLAGSSNDLARYVTAPGGDQYDQVERKERIGRVYRVLDRLPERDRQVLILFELEELSEPAFQRGAVVVGGARALAARRRCRDGSGSHRHQVLRAGDSRHHHGE